MGNLWILLKFYTWKLLHFSTIAFGSQKFLREVSVDWKTEWSKRWELHLVNKIKALTLGHGLSDGSEGWLWRGRGGQDVWGLCNRDQVALYFNTRLVLRFAGVVMSISTRVYFMLNWQVRSLINTAYVSPRPDLIDMNTVAVQSNLANLEHAFYVAEKIGVIRLLDPEGEWLSWPDVDGLEGVI